jgi:hypothetical protein
LVAVGKHRAFVDATGQRQGKYAGQGLGEQRDRLAGVAEDELRLVIRFGFLMEFLDARHLATGLGNLDAVADQDGPAVDAQDARVEPEEQSTPGAGELV